MNVRIDHTPEIDRLDFSNRCEKCAGFCCVAMEISEDSAGTLVKTANAVCEYLDLDAS